MRRLRLILIALILIVAVAALAAHALWMQPGGVREATAADAAAAGLSVPRFRSVPVDFSHVFGSSGSLPLAGAAVIDSDGDGREELFVAGGSGQGDGLLTLRQGRFINAIGGTGLSHPSATYGALSLDLDGDRDPDLVVARDDGLYAYRNDGTGRIRPEKIALDLDPLAIPIAVTAGDVNRDGQPDLYVTAVVGADPESPALLNGDALETHSLLLLGEKGGKFRDATESAGLSRRQNALHALFVDLDNDGWQDLVLAQHTGRILVFRNTGKGGFALTGTPVGLGAWTSVAAGDYDGDGDTDIFVSNVGNTLPAFVVESGWPFGEPVRREWALLRNEGSFQFTDATAQAGLDGYELAWGAVFADMNLDGRPDLVVAQNAYEWPAHRWDRAGGRLLLQSQAGGFIPVTREAGVENFSYGQAPLIGDFDGDGRPDLVFVNVDSPPRAFLSEEGKNQWIRVRLPDDARSLGAKITVRQADGDTATAQLDAGGAFLSDSSRAMIFGLGPDAATVTVEVVWPDGRKRSFSRVEPGTTLTVK